MKNMKFLKEYREKFGVKEAVNEFGEHIQTTENSIIFPNGLKASIINVENEPDTDKKYSVAVCDYDGFFDWQLLNPYGAVKGCIECDTELEIVIACETIRQLTP